MSVILICNSIHSVLWNGYEDRCVSPSLDTNIFHCSITLGRLMSDKLFTKATAISSMGVKPLVS